MRLCLGIDPGNERSAFVWWDGSRVFVASDAVPNGTLAQDALATIPVGISDMMVAVELPSMRGGKVYQELAMTSFWAGRFVEAFERECTGFTVRTVFPFEHMNHVAGRPAAKDAQLKACLIERFGPVSSTGLEQKLGKSGQPLKPTKKVVPGPLFGVTGHCWSALSTAVFAWDSAWGSKPAP